MAQKIEIRRTKTSHTMDEVAWWVDEFGIEWYRLCCPICNYEILIGPTSKVVLREGDQTAGASFPGHRFGTDGLDVGLAAP